MNAVVPSPRVALLIDADNVSADVMEQAVRHVLAEHGAIHVRRAYCNAETALKQQGLFKRLWVRPMVNLSAGKNSTDIALAVDAIDLAEVERPDVVVLVSSDSDYAPLVQRLREKGCRVCGIGQQGKTGDETVALYDSFVDLRHQGGRAAAPVATAPAPARKATRKTAASRAKAVPAADAPVAAAVPTAAAKTAPARKKAAKAAPAAPAAPVVADDARRILAAVPELATGAAVELKHAAERLRAAKLLGKSASSPKLFKKHPALFALTPEDTPTKVRYVGRLPG